MIPCCGQNGENMKLKSNFVVHKTGDECLMVGVGSAFNGMVRSNPTAAKIIELLREDITEAEIVSKMCEIYDADSRVIERDVKSVVAKLREIGAIDD